MKNQYQKGVLQEGLVRSLEDAVAYLVRYFGPRAKIEQIISKL